MSLTSPLEIRKQLGSALGKAGLPYWNKLRDFLVGKLGRSEFEELVRQWINTPELGKRAHCGSNVRLLLIPSPMIAFSSSPQHPCPFHPSQSFPATNRRKRVCTATQPTPEETKTPPASRSSNSFEPMGPRNGQSRAKSHTSGRWTSSDSHHQSLLGRGCYRTPNKNSS